MTNHDKIRQQYQNTMNNAQGQTFERCIKAGCIHYSNGKRAEIDKTPEPFKVTSKQQNGVFIGRFTAHAQPDFQGTLTGGRSICFEAKYTTTDRLKRNILTATQAETLDKHEKMGAFTGVCAGIGNNFYFIPWCVWRDMKNIYGRQYITSVDIEKYRVHFNGAVLFLDYTHNDTKKHNNKFREE